MAEHRVTVEWQAEGDFAANRYSRAHRWRFDGGAVVPASASPQVVPPPLSDPAGVDPEEALVASASSCHMLWFLHLARDAGYDVRSYRDPASGRMAADERGRMAFSRITLRPVIEFGGSAPDADDLARLHHEAHERCFVANTLRCEVVVES
jgi:organic hydroperoxide reductase OsmC/OhrA